MTTTPANLPAQPVTEPHALGTPSEAYDSVLNVIEGLGTLNILDCAAGQGAFTQRLISAGHEVSCCDVLPSNFNVPGVECTFANLNDRIPFEDEQFDVLTCLNAIQRIWARGRFFAEMNRVLRPGGRLILTVYNNNNLMRRAMFLLTGSIISDTSGPPYVCMPGEPNPESCFRYPITVSDILAGMRSVGFELASFDAVIWSKGSLALAPLGLIPLLLQPLAPAAYKKHCQPAASSSAKILFKDCLVVTAKKPEI